MSLSFDNATAEQPLLDFGVGDTSAAAAPSYTLLWPAMTAATAPPPPSPPAVHIAGLRTAYARGRSSGVIETLTPTKRLFFPLHGTGDVFAVPAKTHAIMLRDGIMQNARAYTAPQNRLWWNALKSADLRTSNAHFLAPMHRAPDTLSPMVHSIYDTPALDPCTPLARNGDTHFFNATLIHMVREKAIALGADDAIYAELALHVSRTTFYGSLTSVQFSALAFTLWVALAASGRLLDLPPVAHVGIERMLLLHMAAATTLKAAPALASVPSALYTVLHRLPLPTMLRDERVADYTTTLLVADVLLLSAEQRKYTVKLVWLEPSSVAATPAAEKEAVIRQDALLPGTLVPLAGKAVEGTDPAIVDYVRRHMGVAETDDDFGIGVVGDRFVLYVRPTPGAAPRLKTL